MADQDPAKPAEPPKPVHIGGESFVDRVLPHIRKILAAGIVAVVVAGAVITVRWFGQRKQILATEKLDRVMVAAFPSVHDKDDPTADPKMPSYADAKERAVKVLDTLAKQATDADGHAFRGGLLLDAGKLDDAIAEYRLGTVDKPADKTVDKIEAVLCREGLGLALEAKATADKDTAARQKGLEEALAAFTAEQPDPAGPRRTYALYHQARIQALLGKRAEAKALFEQAKTANKDADREVAELIDRRLAALGST
jgi:tetratricopeptide (TPR) repeat protein